MVEQRKSTRGRYTTKHLDFDYLSDSDIYVFARGEPQHKFNLIGAGRMGHEHMKVTALEGRGLVHGIYDTNPGSLQISKEISATVFPEHELREYDSLTEVCNDPAVDGLIICTPNHTHIEIVREAVKSGKHILLEKPMATTVRDAYEITRLAEDYSSVFQIGLQYRHKAIYAETIHEALERRMVGDLKTLSILEHRIPFLDKVGQWNKFAEYSGGTLIEKCCHYFDLLNLLADSRPQSVYATGDAAVNFKSFEYSGSRSDIIDNALVIVNYENGVRASFNLCMFAPMFYEEITLCGEEGRLRAYENHDYLPEQRPGTYLEILCGEERASRITTPSYPEIVQGSGHSGATYYEHKYFIDNIEGRKTNTATVEEGFWSIVVGAAAEQSVAAGEVVSIERMLEENAIGI